MLAVTLVGSIGEANGRVNGLGQTVVSGGHPAVPNSSWMVFVLVAIAAISLAWRRRFPLTILGVSLTCVAVYSLLGYVNGTALLDVMIALYTVATMVSSREALIAGLVTLLCLLVTTAIGNPFGALGGGEFLIPAEIVAAVSIGVALGNRRAYLRAVEERADQAERTREEEAARRVDAERLRIARELHDAVAHTLSMINVQAGAAAHVAREHPEQAAAALEAIRLASQEGLREMGSIFNVLRPTGEGSRGAQAIRRGRDTHPHVVLMDIRMPGMDGLEATRRIAADADLASVRVLIVTTFEADEYVYQALRAGAGGFLVKDTEPADLIAAVRVIARGDALLSPGITRRLIADIASRPSAPAATPAGLADLTAREREVLTLVGGGLSNDEIAARLFLSPLTAKTHVSRPMSKIGARDRAQLVVLAYENGLVVPGTRDV